MIDDLVVNCARCMTIRAMGWRQRRLAVQWLAEESAGYGDDRKLDCISFPELASSSNVGNMTWSYIGRFDHATKGDDQVCRATAQGKCCTE